jgi:hypothetical protein
MGFGGTETYLLIRCSPFLYVFPACSPARRQTGDHRAGVRALFGEILRVLHHPIVSGHHGQDIIIR